MNLEKEIDNYIANLPEPKRGEIQTLYELVLRLESGCKLWFLDGRNEDGKIVSNPSIGFGSYEIRYADGSTKEFYRVGLSANTSGISVYIMGIDDKKFLAETYGKDLGKASVTGYCIKFKSLKDINVDVLESAIKHRLEMD